MGAKRAFFAFANLPAKLGGLLVGEPQGAAIAFLHGGGPPAPLLEWEWILARHPKAWLDEGALGEYANHIAGDMMITASLLVDKSGEIGSRAWWAKEDGELWGEVVLLPKA
jgi:hypothetical protein